MSLRLSPVEMRNRDLINDPALEGYQVAGRRADADAPARDASAEPVVNDLWSGPFRYVERPGGTVRLVQYEGSDAVAVIPSAIDGARVTELEPHLFSGHAEIERVEVGGPAVGAAADGVPSADVEASPAKGAADADAAIDAAGAADGTAASGAEDAAEPFFATDGRALFTADGSRIVQLVVPCAAYEVPEGCVEVGDHAFDSLADLAHVTLPGTLERIGRLAFAKTGLSELVLPASVRSIGEKAFYFCRNLSSCALPEGLEEIEPEAFASAGLEQVELPVTLARLGERAFEGTPAQKHMDEGAIAFAGGANPYLEIDEAGGLYAHDVFVELMSRAAVYEVRPGTLRVAPAACRRNNTLHAITLPEGLVEIGTEAFRGCQMLTEAHLPESLEAIGERAFLDTSLRTLRLGPHVRSIGTAALLVQGESQLRTSRPLSRLDLDEGNEHFYVESGVLCERGGGAAGGDVCLLYVGPDNVVTIPDAVNRIAPFAFCGVREVDELRMHGHLHSICRGAFAVARSIPRVRVDVTRYIPDADAGPVWWMLFPPSLSARYRYLSHLFDTDAQGTVVNFDYYDSWASHATEIAEFAPAALDRLVRPLCLTEHMREIYLGIFARRKAPVCRFFARRGDMEALEALWQLGVLDEKCVEGELEWAFSANQAQATACLLEIKRRHLGGAGIDFSL